MRPRKASVGEAADEVIREAKQAGVDVFGGGIDEDVAPRVVAADATVTRPSSYAPGDARDEVTPVPFDLPASLDLLERTPSVVDTLLRRTPSSWHSADEGPGTWSPVDVVGHLIHGEETDWVPRARIILEHGEARPFEPFDRFAQLTRFSGWSLPRLLDRFGALRRDNVATVRGWQLTGAQLALVGRHPELGRVSLSQLLATWVAHDLDHLTQINRVLAGQLAAEVGPWRAYLSILRP